MAKRLKCCGMLVTPPATSHGPKCPIRLAEPDAAERYMVEVDHGGGWTKPSVGGIELGFAEKAGAEDLREVVSGFDSDYYAGAKWRIVKVTREVVG